MSSEGDPHVSDVLEAEGLGDLVRSAEVQAAAPKDPAEAQDGTFDYAEAHHAFVEVFGAGGAIDAVCTKKR